ncbi:MAG: helix-turn-helix domain-containing protein [Chloroflexi bacterium]|nr:helix-turn-helix domain-containing protein [Chloroflexota bacterium]
MSSIGDKVKQLRESKDWSQEELAKRSGLSRSYIGALEVRKNMHPRAEYLIKLAAAFNISVDEFYVAAGYTGGIAADVIRQETPTELLEKLRMALPVAVPVYNSFKAHTGTRTDASVGYIYLNKADVSSRDLEGIVVGEGDFPPVITSGDIIVTNRSMSPHQGSLLICMYKDRPIIGRLESLNGAPWIISKGDDKYRLFDCSYQAVITRLHKKLD